MKRIALLGSPRRLRTIATACLCIGTAEALMAPLGIHPPAVIGLIVLAVCLIGIAAIARAWWIEFKQ